MEGWFETAGEDHCCLLAKDDLLVILGTDGEVGTEFETGEGLLEGQLLGGQLLGEQLLGGFQMKTPPKKPGPPVRNSAKDGIMKNLQES